MVCIAALHHTSRQRRSFIRITADKLCLEATGCLTDRVMTLLPGRATRPAQ